MFYQIRSISTIGGSTVKETTRRLLPDVLSDKCARVINWKGKNNKRAFSDLETKTVVIRKLCSAKRMPYIILRCIISQSLCERHGVVDVADNVRSWRLT